mmetsp:Transcript_37092/g.89906  ORF Transcript_37092/g.89906 Transcript_37092/m.89906 type:complete len:166 (+) Transcript_37092:436-933(+)
MILKKQLRRKPLVKPLRRSYSHHHRSVVGRRYGHHQTLYRRWRKRQQQQPKPQPQLHSLISTVVFINTNTGKLTHNEILRTTLVLPSTKCHRRRTRPGRDSKIESMDQSGVCCLLTIDPSISGNRKNFISITTTTTKHEDIGKKDRQISHSQFTSMSLVITVTCI